MSYRLGRVKWFGGFNSKKCQNNNYGFIELLCNKSDIYFNKSVINTGSSENDFNLTENEWVLCSFERNKKGLSANSVYRIKDLCCDVTLFKGIYSKLAKHDKEHASRIINDLFERELKALSLVKPIKKLAGEIYEKLNKEDVDLSEVWAGERNINDCEVMAKMLSARAAENFARDIYADYMGKVEDVAIKQVKGGSDDWMDFDFKCNDSFYDVKNRRVSPLKNKYDKFFREVRYKNHGDRGVKLVGVLSPYTSEFDRIGSPHLKSCSNDELLYLGEVVEDEMKLLIDRFKRVDMVLTDLNLGTRYAIPVWWFNYPKEMRYKRAMPPVVESLIEVVSHVNSKAECERVLTRVKESPSNLPAKRNISEVWLSKFAENVLYFKESLPGIYVSILNDFIHNVSSKKNRYDPLSYKSIIFVEGRLENPLLAVDPLKTINGLIDNLGVVWVNRDQCDIEELVEVTVSLPDIIIGRFNDGKERTIIAYCENCNEKSLIMGVHKNCLACGRLICQCDWCSGKCKENKIRIENKQLKA